MAPAGQPIGGLACVRHGVQAMGTRFEFLLYAEHEGRLREIAEEAAREVLLLHERLTTFEVGSMVSRINREASQGWVRVDRDTWRLLLTCRDAWERTAGAFDVTLGGLMQRHGLHPGHAPSSGWGMRHVEVDPVEARVRFTDPGPRLDLGGIAKGAALDRCREVAMELGIACGFLHAGTSSAVAIGGSPGGGDWVVRIGSDESAPVARLRDCALSVSAIGGRRAPGTGIGHVLDPATGGEGAGAEMSAVAHPSATGAEVWSTALIVRGRLPCPAPDRLSGIVRLAGRWEPVGEKNGCFELAGEAEAPGAAEVLHAGL